MATEIKATSPSEMLASLRAKADAYAKMSPEERAEQDKKTREILKDLGTDGPTVLFVK